MVFYCIYVYATAVNKFESQKQLALFLGENIYLAPGIYFKLEKKTPNSAVRSMFSLKTHIYKLGMMLRSRMLQGGG